MHHPRPSLLRLFFTIQGSIIPKIARRIIGMTLFATAVVFAAHRSPAVAPLSPAPFTLLGIALSIFTSFRNSACYERWWEARKLWGQLIVETRSLARLCQVLPTDTSQRILRDANEFAGALARHLRGEPVPHPIHGMQARSAPSPDAFLVSASRACFEAQQSGTIDGWRVQMIEARLTALAGVQAGCERIRSTPLPFAYHLLLHRTTALFCVMLPFGLADALGYGAPIFVALISYAFFGLDALADELEEPFGQEQNDLSLDGLVETVRREISDAVSATPSCAAS